MWRKLTLQPWSSAAGTAVVVATFMALVLWPLRDAVVNGTIAGAGPDVASTMWAMWWFSKEWAGAAWGGTTNLVNFPAGAIGSVLSPVTAAMWTALARPLGPMAATTWTDVLYLTALLASVSALARVTGLPRVWAVAAGAMVLVPRYPIYAVGETSLVGVTGITFPLGLYGLLRGQREPRWNVCFAVCLALTGIEMPYLAPVLPAIALLGFRSRPALTALAFGTLGLGLIGLMHAHSQSGDFGMMSIVARVHIGPWKWMVIEAPWARSALRDLFVAGPVRWSLDGSASQAACGRDYVGLSVIALSVVGVVAHPKRWPWLLLGVVGMALATGSDWGGYPAPFALLNGIWWRMVRGLTQPTRYLLLPAIAFGVGAAHGLEALWQRSRLLGVAGALAVGLDAFLFGGLSLRLPTMVLAEPACVSALRSAGEGGVLLWPWDGVPASDGVRQRLLQMVHEHPTPGFGVGSWKTLGDSPTVQRFDDIGWAAAARGEGALNVSALRTLGFRWMIVDLSASSIAQTHAWFGEPVATCDGYAVHALQ